MLVLLCHALVCQFFELYDVNKKIGLPVIRHKNVPVLRRHVGQCVTTCLTKKTLANIQWIEN